MGGHCHCSRNEHFLFAVRDELALVHHVEQGAVIIQLKGEGDLESVVPPGRGELPLGAERVIIFGQSLQDHECTSQFRQSSTPCSSFARKN